MEIKGCPENSNCAIELGAARLIWLSALEKGNPSSSRVGAPLSFWATSEPDPKKVISWNSECKNHRIPNPRIYEAESFLKSFKEIKGDGFYPDVAFLLKGSGKIISYLIPRGEIPFKLIGDKLLFVRTEDGHFYNMLVAPDGQVNFSDEKPPSTHFAQNIDCPEALVTKIKNEPIYLKIYQGHLCKGVWNGTSYDTMIFGKGCY